MATFASHDQLENNNYAHQIKLVTRKRSLLLSPSFSTLAPTGLIIYHFISLTTSFKIPDSLPSYWDGTVSDDLIIYNLKINLTWLSLTLSLLLWKVQHWTICVYLAMDPDFYPGMMGTIILSLADLLFTACKFFLRWTVTTKDELFSQFLPLAVYLQFIA